MNIDQNNSFKPGSIIRGFIDEKEVFMCKINPTNCPYPYDSVGHDWVNIQTGEIWHFSLIGGNIYEVDPFSFGKD